MADSNITKRALATALKELMAEVPFEKINVAHICEKCDMNRKSFYYHFRDKYDLVNWIFDTEFIAVVKNKSIDESWQFFSDLCEYLYANRSFYQKALKIKGQNSFFDHFSEMLSLIIANRLPDVLKGQKVQDFHINFFTDGFVCAIMRWIQDKSCIPSDEFIALLESCIW